MVVPGDDLAEIILSSIEGQGLKLKQDDILVPPRRSFPRPKDAMFDSIACLPAARRGKLPK